MMSDPLLLQGREGRWTWPWAVAGTLLTLALIWILAKVGGLLDNFAERHLWIARGLLDLTLDPRQPFTFANVAIAALPSLVVPLVVLQHFHRVPWRRAFAYRGHFDWSQFVKAALALLLVSTPINLCAVFMAPDEFILQRRGLGHVPWALLGLVAIFLASLGEDVLFKGYLFRVWGAVVPVRWPLVVLLVIVFTSLHAGNRDLSDDRAFSLFYFALTEVVWFAVFLRTQNLAAAAGLHWMNNAWDTLLVARSPDQATTLALVVQTGHLAADDALAHVSEILPLGLLLALLLWRRSPFYLPEASASPAGSSIVGPHPYAPH